MPSLMDFDFTGDGGGPDTDPTPDFNTSLFEDDGPDGQPDDRDNYQEPGVGNTFDGQDPTVFAAEGDPDEPTVQQSATVPEIEAEEQTAPSVNDPTTLGQEDDPEAVEQPTDEQAGDDEDDSSDPADIHPDVSSEDEVRYPEQGIDSDEDTVRTPEETIPVYYDRTRYDEVVDPGPGLEVQKLIAEHYEADKPKTLVEVVEDTGDDYALLRRTQVMIEDILASDSLADYLTYLGNKIHGDFDATSDDEVLYPEYDLVEQFQEDMVESTNEGSMLFEPDQVSNEFIDTLWPSDSDDNIYLDMQDFVDIVITQNTDTPSNAPFAPGFLDDGQPIISLDQVTSILAPLSGTGILDDL